MTGPFDIYTDYVSYWMTHWGTTISLHLQDPYPDSDGNRPIHPLGTVRLSNEHLKVLIFNLARTLAQEEMRTHANYDATDEILSQLGIKREDWTRFWNATRETE